LRLVVGAGSWNYSRVPNLEPILNHIGPFLMVLFRLCGLAVFAPVLGSPLIPARVRLLLMFMLALIVYPTLPPDQQTPLKLDVLSMAPAIAAETLIGLTVGLIAALPMYAVQLGGQVMGQQIGMGLAGIYNPALDTESDVIGQMLLFIAITVFAAIGGLDMLFLSIVQTFGNVPAGHALGLQPPVEMFLGVVSSGFGMALRVSAPVLCIIMLETIATGFLMKTLPQLNIMSIGFSLKVVLAFLVLVWGMGAIGEAIGEDVSNTLELILQWTAGLRTGAS
jgi:flagellar biosynthetic protein FliR